jgi:hypothetical protein
MLAFGPQLFGNSGDAAARAPTSATTPRTTSRSNDPARSKKPVRASNASMSVTSSVNTPARAVSTSTTETTRPLPLDMPFAGYAPVEPPSNLEALSTRGAGGPPLAIRERRHSFGPVACSVRNRAETLIARSSGCGGTVWHDVLLMYAGSVESGLVLRGFERIIDVEK